MKLFASCLSMHLLDKLVTAVVSVGYWIQHRIQYTFGQIVMKTRNLSIL